MTQADRDRLVALQKAKKKLITQREASSELGITERHVRRLLKQFKKRGDKAIIHALRGKKSNRRIGRATQQRAVKILSGDVYRGFGPTLAAEYLAKKHDLEVSRETVRKWMAEAQLWKPRKQRIEKIHQWRERRSRYGELVQWDTSDHDWLEGRGDPMKLILMIDDATSKWFCRFVANDSTNENMELLERYLKKHGRPLAYYTDKAGIFQTAIKTKRDEQSQRKDRVEMPPTNLVRALGELGIAWIPAHSPQAKGRVERSFQTAQDRLVKGMRVAGVNTIDRANQYLEEEFLPWCDEALAVVPANPDNAHRPLEKHHDLAAILSYVETRRVADDYTIRFQTKLYQIDHKDIRPGLRAAGVRVEKRRDGSVAVRFREQYVAISVCEPRPKAAPVKAAKKRPTSPVAARPSNWSKDFDLKKAPKIWQAASRSGVRSPEPL